MSYTTNGLQGYALSSAEDEQKKKKQQQSVTIPSEYYNPFGAVQNIYNLKGAWATANAAGDVTAMNKAAENAKQYYESLTKNGYSDLANQLSTASYEQAKPLLEQVASAPLKGYAVPDSEKTPEMWAKEYSHLTPEDMVGRITGLKKKWDGLNAAGDTSQRDAVAEKAKRYYGALIGSGHQDVADLLSNASSEQARKIWNDYSNGTFNISNYTTPPATTEATTTPTNTTTAPAPETTGEIYTPTETATAPATSTATPRFGINKSYDPYADVEAIYKLKGVWSSADASGDTAKRDAAAEQAKQYYANLRANGYQDVADYLQASNYEQSKVVSDIWAKNGKTATRDYLYSLGKSRGMSQSEIDSLIGWDDASGNVSFGGKNIGRPDALVDGVSYWSDTSVLDNAFNDYINRTGTVRSKETAVNQENEKLFSKYEQEYDYLKNTNPFETAEGKAILAKYDLAGMAGRNNEVASGASSNGGNIDSFAAANALRQQASLINQGQMVALEAHQQKLDHARALLSDMGVNIDRVYQQDEQTKTREFNQSETAKNNEAARQSEYSAISGTVGDYVTKQLNSSIWNADGSLKNPSTNFQEGIDSLYSLYKASTDENEKAKLWEQMRVLEIARNQKIDESGSSEGKTFLFQGPPNTADYKLTNKQIDVSADIAAGQNETQKAVAQTNAGAQVTAASITAQTNKDIAGMQAQNNLDQLDKQIQLQQQSQSGNDYAAYDMLMRYFPDNETVKRSFVEKFINY